MLSRTDVSELTVEDPAEAFEDLRDRNDLRYLDKQGIPDDPLFLVGVGTEERGPRAAWEAAHRKKLKIAQVGAMCSFNPLTSASIRQSTRNAPPASAGP